MRWMHILLAVTISLALLCQFAFAEGNETSPVQKLNEISDRFGDMLISVLGALKRLLIRVARAAYSVMGIAGILLWATRVQRMWGRELITGSILLAFIVECVIPCI